MIGGRAGESQHLASSDSPQSPQMISMLLRSCDIQLSDTCQQELNSKLGATALGMAKGEKGRDSSHPGNVFIGMTNDPMDKLCHMFYIIIIIPFNTFFQLQKIVYIFKIFKLSVVLKHVLTSRWPRS